MVTSEVLIDSKLLVVFNSVYREVQLRSPNWLYGEPIVEKSDAKPTVEAQPPGVRKRQEFGDLDWLTSLSPYAEEELFTRYTWFSVSSLKRGLEFFSFF